ncbi:3-oxoacyl-ACP synthase III family protein [Streptomyces scopuliridis]|uniref:3-oxoacyl-ACP synthase III family protein n=1 Tax=Streptomyces scopuliridis TaxID=452529 RepID=UPI00343DA356
MDAPHSYAVLGTGSYLPAEVVGNDPIEMRLGLQSGWIEERTGIVSRHRAADDEATSDLAAEAARRAMAAAGVGADDIAVIVLSTSTPDWLSPATACRVQDLLGARNAAAFDLMAACTGFVYGLKAATAFLGGGTGPGRFGLVIGADLLTRFTNPADRGTSALFGDGAGAAVIGPAPAPYGIVGDIHVGSDGSRADRLYIPAGGSRLPMDPKAEDTAGHTFFMDGRAIKNLVSDVLPRMVGEAVELAGVQREQLYRLVPHQPNPILLERLVEPCGLTPEQVVITGRSVGNIGAGSLPQALDSAVRETPPAHGDLVLLAGMGGGATWARALLRWYAPDSS